MAGVHGLEHVHGLAATDLTDDDPVGAHTERVDQQQPLGHLAPSLDVRGPGLQADHVGLPELELGRVLDRDDALVRRDERRQDVQQRRLPGAGPTGDQDVEACLHHGPEQLEHRLGQAAGPEQVVARQRVPLELPDGHVGPVQGQRRDDGVDPGAVGQAGVHHGRGVVDPASHGGDDPVDDLHEVLVVAEPHARALELAETLDQHLVIGVDQDVGDVRVLHERLQRPQAEDLVQHLLGELLPLVQVEGHALPGEQVLDLRLDGGARLLPAEAVEVRQVEPLQELAVDPAPDLLHAELLGVRGAIHGRGPGQRHQLVDLFGRLRFQRPLPHRFRHLPLPVLPSFRLSRFKRPASSRLAVGSTVRAISSPRAFTSAL